MTKKVLVIAPLSSVHVVKAYSSASSSFDFFSLRSSQRTFTILPVLTFTSFFYNLIRLKYDVIVIHYLSLNVLLSVFLRPFTKKLIGICWGTDVYKFAMKFPRLWMFGASRFHHLAATSQNMCTHVEQHFGLNVLHRPFGLSKHFTDVQIDCNRSRPSTNKIKFAIVKELRHKAGIDRSIKFVVKMAKQFPEHLFVLDIYGSGPERTNLCELARKENSPNLTIHFHGFVEQTFLLKNLPHYDFFIGLSRSESLGLSFIEAAHLGVIPIVSRTPGPLEVFGESYELIWDKRNEDIVVNRIMQISLDQDKHLEICSALAHKLKPYLWEEWSSWYLKV